MGYFSTLAYECQISYSDHSITEPQQQLLWRVAELQDRLVTLKADGAAYSDGMCHTEDDLRYMLPHHFHAIYDTEKAMELAVAELKYTYGVDLYPEPAEEPVMDEISENQLTFLVLLPGIPLSVAA